jgi:hypothetical protein
MSAQTLAQYVLQKDKQRRIEVQHKMAENRHLCGEQSTVNQISNKSVKRCNVPAAETRLCAGGGLVTKISSWMTNKVQNASNTNLSDEATSAYDLCELHNYNAYRGGVSYNLLYKLYYENCYVLRGENF